MKRKAIVHIGLPKTGTTAIQAYLAKNRGALRDLGVALSSAAGRRNHIALAAYAQGKANNAAIRSGGDVHLSERLERALAKEVEELPATVHTVLFSSEQLARVSNRAGSARLRALLAPHFDSIEILVYLRRQDEMAVSRYTTSLQAGGETRYAILPDAEDAPSVFDFARIVDAYAESFGPEAMRLRIYERSAFPEGNVILDFLGAVGLPGMAQKAPLPEVGSSLGAAAQEIMRRFNLLAEQYAPDARPQLAHLLRDAAFRGRARLPSRDEARAFMERYQACNEAIRSRYFTDRSSLFGEDFSRYPEAHEVVPVDASALLETAMQALIRSAMAWQDMKADSEYLLGQKAEASGDLVAARARFGKAVRAKRSLTAASEALERLSSRVGGEAEESKAPESRRKGKRRGDKERDAAPPADKAAKREARRRRQEGRKTAPLGAGQGT